MAVCHLYPTQKIYKGGHETPRGFILLREHGGNTASDFLVFVFIHMLTFSVGVSCGAKKVIVFYAKSDFSMLFLIHML